LTLPQQTNIKYEEALLTQKGLGMSSKISKQTSQEKKIQRKQRYLTKRLETLQKQKETIEAGIEEIDKKIESLQDSCKCRRAKYNTRTRERLREFGAHDSNNFYICPDCGQMHR
jgi:uncharacterized protein YlxW (UPF0749 family)